MNGATVRPDQGAVDAIVQGRHGDPFVVLGPHLVEGGWAVRAFVPGAAELSVVAAEGGQKLATLEQIDPAGFFAGPIPARVPYRLRAKNSGGEWSFYDPYAFPPILGEIDIYLFSEGRHRELGRVLGAHVATFEGVRGVRFAVWAPNARRAAVVGSFNAWDGRRHPMRLHQSAGVWELFVPEIGPGTIYKYELLGPDGGLLPLKADPVASAYETPPATASIVSDEQWHWRVRDWQPHQAADAPISIYEVHAFSWLSPADAGESGWAMLADRLVPYVQRLGFTHVELMPIMEHPFGGSWGYQPLGQFAPSARLGSPAQFMAFVDRCHEAGIGVILDWVPAHFPADAHGLARFDGTPLYEHADPREGFHPDWNTYIFNLGRYEVRGFLIGSALHWLEHFRVDGLRVDAVASMLYRDYSRREGEWVPNRYGGRENLEAVAFLQELSGVVRERCPHAILVAEESTAWPGVTRAASEGGLGFDYKWNMGWMHDTLHYMEENPIHRRWHHDEITFGLIYAFSEKFVLPLSHDEVVYGKGSLIRKMPGDDWQKFANLRAYFGFMWTHPGKKLLFMGGEIAQWGEWNHDATLDWYLLDYPKHAGVQHLVRELNGMYRQYPALHRRDSDGRGFRWVVIDDRDQSVYAYLRFGEEGDAPVLVVCNLTPVPRDGYRIGVPQAGPWREVLNTDADAFGGSNMGNAGMVHADYTECHGLPASLQLILPALATLVLSPSP
jgi:1,4-alpha-glucan branching enzyme